jgi:hypothetical protein
MCAFMFPLAHTESRPGVLCPPRSGRSESEAPLPVCYTIYLNAHTAQTMQRGRAAARRALRSGARAFYGFGLSMVCPAVGRGEQGFCFCTSDRGMVSHTRHDPRPTDRGAATAATTEARRARGAERSLRGRRATQRARSTRSDDDRAEETQPRGPKQPGGSGARRCTGFHRRRLRRAERASSDRAERAPCIGSFTATKGAI